jgi:hypothetical protein
MDALGNPLELVDECDELSFGLDPNLGHKDLDLSANMPWFDSEGEDPFGSLDSPASLCIPSPRNLGGAGMSDDRLGSGPLLSSSNDGDSDVFFADGPSSRPPADATMDALRASKCGTSRSLAAVEATAQEDTKTPVAQVQSGGNGSKLVMSSQGHVVRMMPVWMMPTAQHPQGRMIMMPVHFLPGPAAAAAPRVPAAASSKPRGSVMSASRPESCNLSTQCIAADVVCYHNVSNL